MFIGGFGIQELLLIGFLVLLFFGGKKIPEPMKGMGKGIRSFKEGMNGREKEKTIFNREKGRRTKAGQDEIRVIFGVGTEQ